jgi:prolipoprotein diacylglyceryltransferase
LARWRRDGGRAAFGAACTTAPNTAVFANALSAVISITAAITPTAIVALAGGRMGGGFNGGLIALAVHAR